MEKSPTEVKKAISKDLKKRGISHDQAAELLGIQKSTFSSILYHKTYFARNLAARFSEVFGYRMSFLMCGEGSLIAEEGKQHIVKASSEQVYGSPLDYIQELEKNNEIALRVYRKLISVCEGESKALVQALLARCVLIKATREVNLNINGINGELRPVMPYADSSKNIADIDSMIEDILGKTESSR